MRRRQMEADYAVASARANRQSINLYAQLGYTGTGENMSNAYRHLLSNEVVSVGITVPLLDWGKRKGQRRLAESNRDIIQGQLRQQAQDFRQDIFILTEQFNNQAEQLRIACEADTIARRRYHTNVETFKIGSISTDRQGPGPPEPHPAALQLLVLLLSATQHRPLGLRAWLRTHGRRRTSH